MDQDWTSARLRDRASHECLDKIGVKLSGEGAYKVLAGHLGFTPDEIERFGLRKSEMSPGHSLLDTWQKREGSTIRVLVTMLQKMRRDDVIDVLKTYTKDPQGTLVLMIDDKFRAPTVSLDNTLGSALDALVARDDEIRLYVGERCLELVSPELGENWYQLPARECLGMQLNFKVVSRPRSRTTTTRRTKHPEPSPKPCSEIVGDQQRKAMRIPSDHHEYEPLLPEIRDSVTDGCHGAESRGSHASSRDSAVSMDSCRADIHCTSTDIIEEEPQCEQGRHEMDSFQSAIQSSSLNFASDSRETEVKQNMTSDDSDDDVNHETPMAAPALPPRRKGSIGLLDPLKRLALRHGSGYVPDPEGCEEETTDPCAPGTPPPRSLGRLGTNVPPPVTPGILLLNDEISSSASGGSSDSGHAESRHTERPGTDCLGAKDRHEQLSPVAVNRMDFDRNIPATGVRMTALDEARHLPGFHERAVGDTMIQRSMALHIKREGAYIIRPSRTLPGAVCISVIQHTLCREIVSFRIHEVPRSDEQTLYYLFDDGPRFRTLMELITHYRAYPMIPLDSSTSGPRLLAPIMADHRTRIT